MKKITLNLRRKLNWWCWVAKTVLLFIGLAGWFDAFYLATALSALQMTQLRLRDGGFRALAVQVRVVYTGMLLLALWGPMHWLFWAPAIGTLAQVLFGYCTLARSLSLLPWNRSEPLSWLQVRQTFSARPLRGVGS